MIPKIVAVGGNGRVTLYMYEGYDKLPATVESLCIGAASLHIHNILFVLLGDLRNPNKGWPVFAFVELK